LQRNVPRGGQTPVQAAVETGDRHGTSLRHLANLSHRHHRPTGYRDHTDPKDWPGLEGRRSGSNGQKPDPPRQTAEIRIRIALLNRFNALGTAEIARFG
jgi:hypothetical protein